MFSGSATRPWFCLWAGSVISAPCCFRKVTPLKERKAFELPIDLLDL